MTKTNHTSHYNCSITFHLATKEIKNHYIFKSVENSLPFGTADLNIDFFMYIIFPINS